MPIQESVELACIEEQIEYGGIDASINPGLGLPDSVGAGMECLLATIEKDKQFGSSGTLGIVSSITGAIKTLRNQGKIKLTGYSGLMLPVMEDIILAERASQVQIILLKFSQ